MKYKQALAALAATAALSSAHAQSAHTFYVTTGWFRFMPQEIQTCPHFAPLRQPLPVTTFSRRLLD